MQAAQRFLVALGLVALSASSFAATTVYTSSSAFMAAVAPGSYTNTFTGLAETPPATYSSGGFAYTVSAPGGLYSSGSFLGANLPADALTITFTGAGVTAVGANFFDSNISDVFQSLPVTVTLSDATTVTFTPTSVSDSFRGFTSTVAITSLTFSAPPETFYANLDNLTVGVAAVPEPGTWALMGLGVAGLLVAGKRRKA